MNRWFFQLVRTDRGRAVRYYVTDNPSYKKHTRTSLHKASETPPRQDQEPVFAGERLMKGTKPSEAKDFARAQIRVFQKTGHYDSQKWPDVWTWMRIIRSQH